MSPSREDEPGREHGRPIVVLDANVLYPAQLRDLLMRLAVAGLMRAHWTDEIHEEWMRAVQERHPDLSPAVLSRTRVLMERALPTARITGYRRRMSHLTLPDPDDRHVVAAALTAGASTIVTFNERDFPLEALSPYGLKAVHPDVFVQTLYEMKSEQVVMAVHQHRTALRKSPLTVDAYSLSWSERG